MPEIQLCNYYNPVSANLPPGCCIRISGSAGAGLIFFHLKPAPEIKISSAVIGSFPGNCDIMGMALVKSRVGYSHKLCLF
jgi:hypothetical protein